MANTGGELKDVALRSMLRGPKMESGSKPRGCVKRTCLVCLEPVKVNDHWRPPVGIDPHLREFKCLRCGFIFFVILPVKDIIQQLTMGTLLS